ncbi:hypothetical protein [Paenibacillus tuaregi]|uniref:hypothetical protein n=1 Tax=Paenibacillus tuaregi TaxID=1816681 RepID=UPI00083824F1|nr:hypothetical protein [Paenibacillus tuaregi]
MKVSKRLASSAVLSFILVFMLLAAPVSVGAEASKGAALTSPPPQETNTYILGAANKYLYGGNVLIESNGSLKVKCTAETIANQKVESMGIIFTLQRWTGTNWEDGPSVNLSDSNVSNLKGYANFEVKSGYYYRAKAVLWVSQGGIYEQSVVYSNSLLGS